MNYQETLANLRESNAQLRSRVSKLERSRDQWKEKAVSRKRRIEELARRPRRRPSPPRTYSAEQWRQHDLIVARIRAIPNRDILSPLEKVKNGL